MYQLLRSIQLIGYHQNKFIVEFLCIRVSLFDFLVLPEKVLPGYQKTRKTKDRFAKSGYKIKVALFFMGILFAQILGTLFSLAFLPLFTYLMALSLCKLH